MVSIHSLQFKLEIAASEKSKCHRVSAKLVSIAFLKLNCGVSLVFSSSYKHSQIRTIQGP